MINFKPYFSINIFQIKFFHLKMNESEIGQVIRKRRIKKCESYHLGLLVGIVLFFAIPDTYCQIRGSVKNDKGQPIAFTNIFVLEKVDSSLNQGVICDESGKFQITQVPKGSYLISAQMLGYEPVFSSPVLVEGRSDQIMEFILKEEMSELSEVLVSAQKPLFEQQMGKLVVNVNSSIISSGSTILEVLSRTPGIQINQQKNSFTINGKDGVMIMLNGKLVRLPLNAVVQMLSGMNADQVSTIEIINSPPA